MIATITCAPRTSCSDRYMPQPAVSTTLNAHFTSRIKPRVDGWIVAACQQLHEAVAEHLAAVAEQQANSQL